METERSEKRDKELLDLDNLVLTYNQEVAHFFNRKEPKKINLKVYNKWGDLAEAYLDDDITKEFGITEAPTWLTGFNSKGGTIHVLSWEIFPKRDSDPVSSFKKTIKHEIAHFYFGNWNMPQWLAEGVCMYVAGQKGSRIDGNITIERLIKADENSGEMYSIGKAMVEKIIEAYGKEKLFQLVQMEKESVYQELREMFEWLK